MVHTAPDNGNRQVDTVTAGQLVRDIVNGLFPAGIQARDAYTPSMEINAIFTWHKKWLKKI